MFNDAVDRFEPLFRTGGVYRIARFEVKMGNPRFVKPPQQYDMMLNNNSLVEEVNAHVDAPRFLINPIPIADLQHHPATKEAPPIGTPVATDTMGFACLRVGVYVLALPSLTLGLCAVQM